MNRRGQILVELLVCLALLIGFIGFSVAFYSDFEKTSYRYMLTRPKD